MQSAIQDRTDQSGLRRAHNNRPAKANKAARSVKGKGPPGPLEPGNTGTSTGVVVGVIVAVMVLSMAGSTNVCGAIAGDIPGVSVAVGVLVGVAVGVSVGVLVGVAVGVSVGVFVGVEVGVLVGVTVGVAVAVGVFVGRAGVRVGGGSVGVGDTDPRSLSCWLIKNPKTPANPRKPKTSHVSAASDSVIVGVGEGVGDDGSTSCAIAEVASMSAVRT